MIAAAIFALALLAAPEANTEAAPAAEPKPAAEAQPKKVCKRQEDVSGSRLAKRVCVTVKPKAAKEADAAPAEADKPAA